MRDLIGANVKHLDHPNVGAIFFGILAGVLLGQVPIPIPGVDIPVKLGLAGGPLVVAILIGAFGYRYKINSYTSTSANMLLREVGLILFLSSVGIQAGAKFLDTVLQGDGVHYIWMGFLITIIPILIMASSDVCASSSTISPSWVSSRAPTPTPLLWLLPMLQPATTPLPWDTPPSIPSPCSYASSWHSSCSSSSCRGKAGELQNGGSP